jgi:dienelactone hydrolase
MSLPCSLRLSWNRIAQFDWRPWVGRHPPSVGLALTQKVVAALTAQGATTFGATGYCYGGRIGMDLAFENVTLKALVISHPSLLQVPADFEVRPRRRLQLARCDLLISSVPRN